MVGSHVLDVREVLGTDHFREFVVQEAAVPGNPAFVFALLAAQRAS